MFGEQDVTPENVNARRRRWWLAAAGALGIVVVAGAVAALAFLRESETPIDVDAAVDDFRAAPEATSAEGTAAQEAGEIGVTTVAAPSSSSSSTAPPPGSTLPAPGVYTYATTGSESVDALDGRSHQYPVESTITVTHEGCGAVHAWRPLQERWDATTVCPSGAGHELAIYRSHHEFFGLGDTRDFVCEAGSLWYPASTAPRTTWTTRCGTDTIQVARAGTIVGTSQLDVGGTPVTVLTFQLHDEISGASTGTTDRTVRVVPDTGLIVELSVVVDVRNDSPLGDVHYEERYELRLTSLNPLR